MSEIEIIRVNGVKLKSDWATRYIPGSRKYKMAQAAFNVVSPEKQASLALPANSGIRPVASKMVDATYYILVAIFIAVCFASSLLIFQLFLRHLAFS